MNNQKKSLRNRIFKRYHSIHGKFLDAEVTIAQRRFNEFCKTNLLEYLPRNHKNIRILEIGSYKGFILKWLEDQGFLNIEGVDLSPEGVNFSKHYVFNNQKIFCQDAFDYLSDKKNKYDLIISKAVLEHIPKSDISDFLTLIYKSLKSQGRVIIYVPNMDWIMAQHERYMDLTHEVGFTRESLGELLRLYFDDVNILPVDYDPPSSIKSKIVFKMMKPIVIKLTRLWLKVLGEGAGDYWFEYRAITGTGIKKTREI